MDTKYNKNYLSWLFIALIIITGAYLTVKATYENSWDGWGFASAQTMETIEHWTKDGWANHYFLFIPVGYSKITRYFNDPNLIHHAWINVTGTGAKALHYTHYPSGYLFPLAFLRELGLKNRFWFRFFQILISLGSLLLLYKFFNLITNQTIAFFAVLFYTASVPFLDYADSLANQPIDDLLRAAILVVSMLAIRAVSLRNEMCHSELTQECHPELTQKCHPELASPATPKRSDGGRVSGSNPMRSRNKTCAEFISVFGITPKFYFGLIWFLYLILSLSSYDSTFFVFVWLVGLDVISQWHLLKEGVKSHTKWLRAILVQGLFFASAPILAFIIQIIQNSWYLGLSNALSDFLTTFNKIGLAAGSSQGFVMQRFMEGILYPIKTAFAFSFGTRYTLIAILTTLIILFILKVKKEGRKEIPHIFQYLFLLGAAGFSQSLILAQNTPYKGRLLGVFAALLTGTIIFLIINFIKNKTASRLLIFALILFTIFISVLQTSRTFAYIQQWPNNVYNQNTINFTKKLKAVLQPLHLQDVVTFILFPQKSQELLDATMVAENYYTASYQDMYYYNTPILLFDNTTKMAADFNYLRKISEYPFSALMIMKDKNQVDELIQLLQKTSPKFNEESIKTFMIQDKYILLISP